MFGNFQDIFLGILEKYSPGYQVGELQINPPMAKTVHMNQAMNASFLIRLFINNKIRFYEYRNWW